MAKTYNGWTALNRVPSTYFTAPNGKRVYCANADVAKVFEYVAAEWHKRVTPLEKATVNIGDPGVRTGFIVIHAYRAPNTNIGTGNMSNHRSATGMDINGHLHPYEASNPPHLKGPNYRDGFTNAQRNELRKIQQEVGRARGRLVLRLGIDFAIGLRDGMHVEIAPGVTPQDVKAAAAALRTAEEVIDWTAVHRMLLDLGYTADESGVRAFQSAKDDWGHNLTVDGTPGDKTTRALEDAVSKIDEVLNILNHHIRGDISKDDQAGLGTGRNLPLREVIILNGVRVNAQRSTLAAVEATQAEHTRQNNVVGRIAAEARELARSAPARVVAFRVPFQKGTSAFKTFGKDFRFGALLAYAGQAFYRRQEQTEDIIEGVVEQIDMAAIDAQVQAEQDAEDAAVEEQS